MKVVFVFSLLMFLYAGAMAQGKCISGNCYNGTGTYRWDDGAEYTGEWTEGKRTGIGVYDWGTANGAYYYGYFVNGLMDGKGFYLTNNADDDLIGVFHEGQFEEKTFIDTLGCILGDCKNGAGVFVWKTGDMYVGDFINNGERSGYGRYDWIDGAIYIGDFKKGRLDGQGMYKAVDGTVLEGPFSNGDYKGVPPSNTQSNTSTETSTLKEEDLCSVLKAIVVEYPNNFEIFKGQQNKTDSNSWDSNIRVAGAMRGKVYTSNDKIYWNNLVYQSSDSTAAINKYFAYRDTINHCTLNSGTMASNQPKELKIVWKAFDGNATYKDMDIELEVRQNKAKAVYNVVLTVNRAKP